MEDVHEVIERTQETIDSVDLDVQSDETIDDLENSIVEMIEVNTYMESDDDLPAQYVSTYPDAYEEVDDLETSAEETIQETEEVVDEIEGTTGGGSGGGSDGDDDDDTLLIVVLVLSSVVVVVVVAGGGLYIFNIYCKRRREEDDEYDIDTFFSDVITDGNAAIAAAEAQTKPAGEQRGADSGDRLKTHLHFQDRKKAVS